MLEYLQVKPEDVPLSEAGFTNETLPLWNRLEELDNTAGAALRPASSQEAHLRNAGEGNASEGLVDKNSGVEVAPKGSLGAYKPSGLDT